MHVSCLSLSSAFDSLLFVISNVLGPSMFDRNTAGGEEGGQGAGKLCFALNDKV